jgi:hypothetical protein
VRRGAFGVDQMSVGRMSQVRILVRVGKEPDLKTIETDLFLKTASFNWINNYKSSSNSIPFAKQWSFWTLAPYTKWHVSKAKTKRKKMSKISDKLMNR